MAVTISTCAIRTKRVHWISLCAKSSGAFPNHPRAGCRHCVTHCAIYGPHNGLIHCRRLLSPCTRSTKREKNHEKSGQTAVKKKQWHFRRMESCSPSTRSRNQSGKHKKAGSVKKQATSSKVAMVRRYRIDAGAQATASSSSVGLDPRRVATGYSTSSHSTGSFRTPLAASSSTVPTHTAAAHKPNWSKGSESVRSATQMPA